MTRDDAHGCHADDQPANGSSSSLFGVIDSPRSATGDSPNKLPSFASLSCTAAFSATATAACLPVLPLSG